MQVVSALPVHRQAVVYELSAGLLDNRGFLPYLENHLLNVRCDFLFGTGLVVPVLLPNPLKREILTKLPDVLSVQGLDNLRFFRKYELTKLETFTVYGCGVGHVQADGNTR